MRPTRKSAPSPGAAGGGGGGGGAPASASRGRGGAGAGKLLRARSRSCTWWSVDIYYKARQNKHTRRAETDTSLNTSRDWSPLVPSPKHTACLPASCCPTPTHTHHHHPIPTNPYATPHFAPTCTVQ